MSDGRTKIESNPASAALFERLQRELSELGEHSIEVKATSLHIVHGRAFLGVHPRKTGLLLNIVTRDPIDSARVRRRERVSAKRIHNEILIQADHELDDELRSWLALAYESTL